jgi:hypothetical protein
MSGGHKGNVTSWCAGELTVCTRTAPSIKKVAGTMDMIAEAEKLVQDHMRQFVSA